MNNSQDTSNITENKIDNFQLFDINNAPSRTQRKVKNDTIIFSIVRPNLKHYGILKNPPANLIVSTGFTTIDIKEEELDKILPHFLYYKLTQPQIINYLHTIAENSVSSYPSINPSDLGNLSFTFPNLSTQKKIAKVFSTLDEKIALNRNINAKLEAMAKQLYDYWFVQFDFPNTDGKPYKSSGGKMVWNKKIKREIPEGWEDGTLSQIANITMGQSPDGASYNSYGEGILFYQGSTDFGLRFPSVRQYTTAPNRLAKKGDILMSVRAPVGALNIANNDCCIGRGLAAMNSKKGSITHLYYILNDLRQVFDNKNGVGTTFGSITKDELFTLPVVVPAKNSITAFEIVCKPIFDKQMLIGEQIDNITTLRDQLIPLLMNGQVGVE